MNHAIDETIERLAYNPPNNLPNKAYRAVVKAGWDDQWCNWDNAGGAGWGDVGDGPDQPGPDR